MHCRPSVSRARVLSARVHEHHPGRHHRRIYSDIRCYSLRLKHYSSGRYALTECFTPAPVAGIIGAVYLVCLSVCQMQRLIKLFKITVVITLIAMYALYSLLHASFCTMYTALVRTKGWARARRATKIGCCKIDFNMCYTLVFDNNVVLVIY